MYHHHSTPPPPAYPSMSSSGIQGGLLEVTVVGCTKLKDTEWISRQDPYVCLEYGSTKFRTRTCTDGHKNPTFQEKFSFTLIEGLREISVQVWNSNTLTMDDFIGSGKIQLQKVLSEGFDDNSWTLHTKSKRYAGEVRLILHYADAHKPASHHAPSASPHAAPSAAHVPLYSAPPSSYPAPYPPPMTAYPTTTAYPSYPPTSAAAYPPNPYPPPPQPYAPHSAYPPPPPPSGSPYYPPGAYPGTYPPRPY